MVAVLIGKICLTPVSGYGTDPQFPQPFGPPMDLPIDRASSCCCLWPHEPLSGNSSVTHTTPSSNGSQSQRSQCILLRILTNWYSGEKIFKLLFRAVFHSLCMSRTTPTKLHIFLILNSFFCKYHLVTIPFTEEFCYIGMN